MSVRELLGLPMKDLPEGEVRGKERGRGRRERERGGREEGLEYDGEDTNLKGVARGGTEE